MVVPDIPEEGLERRAFRASILHLEADPGPDLEPSGVGFWPDGLLVVAGGHVAAVGDAAALLETLPPDTPVTDHRGRWIVPGFVDAHVHSAQTDVIASFGTRLLDWLETYTFPAEARFADPEHARAGAELFVEELLRNGTTTALVLGSVHRTSADAVFEAARARGMCLVAGKVLMDRNCPEYLRDTAATGYDESRDLIETWHGRDRLRYAVTPRFAPTSSDEQLAAAARLLEEYPDVYLHTHLAENVDEVAWVAELFPGSRSYLDVYDRHGLVRPRSVFAHGIHVDAEDRRRLGEAGAALAFCPTSNLFLGSGLFDHDAARVHGVRVGTGTDVGGGTSFSLLRTLHEGYKVCQLAGQTLTPYQALYLGTLGGARALYLDDRIGSFAPGREADFVVLDPGATPLLAHRMARAESLAERLFVLLMLGDDRTVAATHVMGQPVWVRP